MKLSIPTRWIDPDPSTPIPDDLLVRLGGNALLARAMVNRGIDTWEQAKGFLDPTLYRPADPNDLPDMPAAIDRLHQALKAGERIGVWGDFDVDGQTATALLVGVLRGLGGNVKYHIPVRARESHGVNLPGLIAFLAQGVSLVITCDTGITAFEAATYLSEQGIDYIVTDHHSLGESLPNTLAVINPQRLPADHPFRSLAGVGVAYQVARALCAAEGKPELAQQQLDLVALGCVADVASLSGDVRFLVQLGIEQLRDPSRAGLRALYERAELNPVRLTEQHIGFVIGPRLNAIGRLSDANPMVDFLTTADETTAAETAARLEGLNGERRFMTEQVLQGALDMIERDQGLAEAPALILNHPEWPAGVVGIVASHLVSLFHKPVILLSSPAGEPARGSARSIEGVNITRAIAAGADLLMGYGGHPMAAGLAIEPGNLPAFRQRVFQSVKQQTIGLDLTRTLKIDGYVAFEELTHESVSELERLAPFGAGNPPITLAAQNVKAVEVSPIGKSGEHLQVIVEDAKGNLRRIVWWQGVRDLIPDSIFDLAFTARTSTFRGGLDVQLEWVDARLAETQAEIELSPKAVREFLDFRTSADPINDLRTLVTDHDAVIWRAGGGKQDLDGLDLDHLVPAELLVIWNPPPGNAELQQALQVVQPKKVALFAVSAGVDDPQAFLVQLTGLVRHAIRTRAGEISLSLFAGILNQRKATIEYGIRYLIARGFVRRLDDDDGEIILTEAGVPDPELAAKLEKNIRTTLEESAAFKAFYVRADPLELFGVS